jgi:hypothetical protein
MLSRTALGACAFLAVSAVTTAALAQFNQPVLLVPDSSSTTGRRIIAFSAQDGSLVNPSFINLTTAVPGATTPKAIVRVENELWVTDQVADRIDRFTLQGAYIASINDAVLDNIRGLHYSPTNQRVYVAVNGVSPNGIIAVYNTSGTLVSQFNCLFSPFDVFEVNGTLLVTNSQNNTIQRFDLNGTLLGTFSSEGGANRFYQQITRTPANTLLIAAFSGSVAGIYEFDLNGTQLGYTSTGTGLRGAFELGNGRLFFTDAQGARVRDRGAPPGAGANTLIHGCNCQYITYFNPNAGAPLPCNPSDIAATDASPGPDGCVDNGDFLLFVSDFFSASCDACGLPGAAPCGPSDIARTDASPGPDGCVDNGDFLLFVSGFFSANCPNCGG